MFYMSKLKALVIGDTAKAHWHFMNAAESYIKVTLDDKYDLTFTEDYSTLTLAALEKFDLLVNYTDNWAEQGTVSAGVALQTYVANGGQMLSLHSGIIQPDPFFLMQMQGGRFVGHDPYCVLKYSVVGDVHPITAGIDSFEMGEEPYEFLIDPLAVRQEFLSFEYQGKTMPAGWFLQYGHGRIVYLQPGHDAKSFAEASFQKLIRNSALWLNDVI